MAQALVRYLDYIRKSKHLTIDELTMDIISTRQYKRYLNGSSDLPYSIFEQLSERLSIDEMSVFNDLDYQNNVERDQLDTLYTSIVQLDFNTAKTIIDAIEYDELSSKPHQLYFTISHTLYKQYQKLESIEQIRAELESELDYPAILKHTAFTTIEILGLGTLMGYYPKEERSTIINKLFGILVGDLITIGPDTRSTQYVIPRVAKELGINGEYQKVIDLCEKGLVLSKRTHSTLNVDYLHYYIALSHNYLGNVEQRNVHLNKLYHFLMFLDNDLKYKKFDDLVQGDYHTPLSDYK